MTPFGRAVLPEEYCRTAMSAGRSGAGAAGWRIPQSRRQLAQANARAAGRRLPLVQHARREVVFDDEDGESAIGVDVAQEAGHVEAAAAGRPERHRDRAPSPDPEDQRRILGTVLEHQADAVAGANAQATTARRRSDRPRRRSRPAATSTPCLGNRQSADGRARRSAASSNSGNNMLVLLQTAAGACAYRPRPARSSRSRYAGDPRQRPQFGDEDRLRDDHVRRCPR